MIRQTFHIDHPDGTIEVNLCKGCEEDSDEASVEITDPWGNTAHIPVSAFAEVDKCMQAVIAEYLRRDK